MSIQPTLRRLKPAHARNIHTISTSNNKESQIFKLPDGRSLGYAEYGNPNGKPLLYFHGYPSSRIEAEPADEMARRCGLRLLALDRPGFGISTAQPGRKMLDWSEDVRAFATGMGLERFAVMGLSGGGPFALACAYALPRNMVSAVGLFASGPPWEAGKQHMSLVRRISSAMAKYWPTGLGIVLSLCVRGLRAIATAGPVIKRLDAWLELESKKKEDEKLAEEPSKQQEDPLAKKTTKERREYLLRLLIDEPFNQGSAAAVEEAELLSSQDWGFKLEDVDFDTIRIWHGAKDANAPIVMMRYLADKLPHSVLREYENDSHYTMFPHLEGAMRELSGDYDAVAPSSSS